MKLLIIGAGVWARKIESVCISSDEPIETTVESSRVFLKNANHFISELDSYDRIWICTRPQFQLQILSLLSSYEGVVILEKPYVETVQNFSELISTVNNSKSKVVLSQPWTFSNAWSAFKKFSKEDSPAKFEIIRIGNKAHDYIDPVSDWLPHDLNLILDLTAGPLADFRIFGTNWNLTKDRVRFNISINETSLFKIDSGLTDKERVSIWKCDSVKIDFYASTLTDTMMNVTSIKESHPIVQFLKSCDRKMNHDIETSLLFHHRVMHELGL